MLLFLGGFTAQEQQPRYPLLGKLSSNLFFITQSMTKGENRIF